MLDTEGDGFVSVWVCACACTCMYVRGIVGCGKQCKEKQKSVCLSIKVKRDSSSTQSSVYRIRINQLTRKSHLPQLSGQARRKQFASAAAII